MPIVDNSDSMKVNKTQVTVILTAGLKATAETDILGFGACPLKTLHPGRIAHTQPPHPHSHSLCAHVSFPLNKGL